MDDQRRTKIKKRKPRRLKQNQLIDEYWYEEENGRIEEAKDLSWVDCWAEMANGHVDKFNVHQDAEYSEEFSIYKIVTYEEELM